METERVEAETKINGLHFANDNFNTFSLIEMFEIALKFVYQGPISNNPALFQIVAKHRISDKPLYEPMMALVVDAYIRH